MTEVRVIGVAIDSSGQKVILLKPTAAAPGEGNLLPIWIGDQEATSILVAVEGAQMPRPLAHDLMRSIVEALGARIDRVEITSLDEGTFYAVAYIVAEDGEHVVDARPSDAVALASRTGAPIFINDTVLEEAGIPDTVTAESSESDAPDSAGLQEERLDEFRRFLDTVDPEDFGE